jgi:prepilin-type N-terminal cleavage/methylation domain-containing protein
VNRRLSRYARNQDGFTLVEVIITAAIGAMVMTALTSVILTSVNASKVATSRVEASGQMRNFEFYAYDDFAHSGVPGTSGCGTVDNQCTTQPIVLNGLRATNSVTPATSPYQVSYSWDGAQFLDRQFGGGATHTATSVTGFSWYVDSSAAHPTVVVSLTVTVGNYSESQTFRFFPRVNP